MTRDEAMALWEQQFERDRLVRLSTTLGVRAREYSEKAVQLEAQAEAYLIEAKEELERAGERQREALAITPLTFEQMGELYAYAEGRGEKPGWMKT